jgi:hypothetical protein
MNSLKRKRNLPSTTPNFELYGDWGDHIDSLLHTLKNYEDVSHVRVIHPCTLILTYSVIARIPVHLDHELSCPRFKIMRWVEFDSKQNALRLHIKYLPDGKRTDVSTDAPVETVTRHMSELQDRLRLRNTEAIENIKQILLSVYANFSLSVQDSVPYEIVFHKQHNQLILRFKLSGSTPEVHALTTRDTMWIEFQKLTGIFWLVVVVSECV